MKQGIDLLVMDEDFQIIQILNYTNLQWTRKYYESGTFSVEIPAELYSKEFKYLYTKDRPEMGLIEQVNYYTKNGYQSVSLSGYFLENKLNRRIVYQKTASSNITNAPNWVLQSGKAEDVATAFFDAFKDVTFTKDGTTHSICLGVATATSKARGKNSEHTRGNEYLGNKIYTILKPSKMSYSVSYDFSTSIITFSCWSGLDRTFDNTEGNNPVVFSTQYGNITEANLLIDSTAYKNAYFVTAKQNDDVIWVYAGSELATDDDDAKFIQVDSAQSKDDFSTDADYINALYTEGHEELLNNTKTINLDFDTIQGSYEYMTDFDLGDICSIEIPELGLSLDAVLSAIYEVIKNGVWTISLEFITD